MLNKELILIPKEGKGYTHTLVVGIDMSSFTAGYGYSSDGNLLPDTIDINGVNTRITYLYEDLEFAWAKLTIDGFLDIATPLHLGRYDTKKYLGTPSTIVEQAGYAVWQDSLGLRWQTDGGIEIPIWLATTPPPWA